MKRKTRLKRRAAKTPSKLAILTPLNWRDVMLTTDEAGAAVKIGGERIRQRTKEGWIVKSDHNAYRLGDVIDGELRYRDDQARKAEADSEQSKLAAARRREIEQRIAREDHRLVAIDEVNGGVDYLVDAYKAALTGLAAGVTRDLELRAKIDEALMREWNRCCASFEMMKVDLATTGEFKPD